MARLVRKVMTHTQRQKIKGRVDIKDWAIVAHVAAKGASVGGPHGFAKVGKSNKFPVKSEMSRGLRTVLTFAMTYDGDADEMEKEYKAVKAELLNMKRQDKILAFWIGLINVTEDGLVMFNHGDDDSPIRISVDFASDYVRNANIELKRVGVI